MIRTAAFLMIALAASPVAQAQCRVVQGGFLRQRVVVYPQQVVVRQAAVAGYGYYANQANAYVARDYVVQKVVTQKVAVVDVPVVTYAVPVQAYGGAHYYSVQESYQQKAAIRDVIREELKAYLGQQPTAPAVPSAPNVPSAPSAPKTDGPPLYSKDKPTDLGKDTTTPKEIADPVLKAFQAATCLKCHGGPQAAGKLRLAYDEGGVLSLAKQTPERRWVVYGQASTGVMPPAARDDASKAMKQEDLPALLRWVLQN